MSGTPVPKAKPRKKPKNQRDTVVADALFGQVVRAPGRCLICSSSEHVQCAHGFSRRYRNVRWDTRNAFPLCRAHHVFYTHRPIEWDTFLRGHWGADLYDELRDLALNGPKPDMAAVIAGLRERLKEAA